MKTKKVLLHKKKKLNLSKFFLILFHFLRPIKFFVDDKKNIFLDFNPMERKKSFKTLYNLTIVKIIKKINNLLYLFYDHDFNERKNLI